MKGYVIYFEFFGKKMKTNIYAENEKEAKEILQKKIIIQKIEKKKMKIFDSFDIFPKFGKNH